jgi:hypothetical protein
VVSGISVAVRTEYKIRREMINCFIRVIIAGFRVGFLTGFVRL